MNQPEFSAFKPINLSFSSSLSSCSSISSSSSSANCFPSKSSKTMTNNTKESKLTDDKLRKNIQPRAKVFDDEVNGADKTGLLQTQNRQDVNPYYMEKFLNFHDMFNLNGVDPFKNVAPCTSNIGLSNEQLFQLNFQQQLIAFQNIFKNAAQNRDLFTANYIKQIQNEYAKNTMTQATNNNLNHKTKMNNQNQYFKNNFSMDRILSLPSKIETSNELNGGNLKKEEYASGTSENEMANFFHNNINSAFPVRTATGFHKLNPQIALSVPLAQSIPTYSTNNNHRQTHQQPHTSSSHSKPMRNVFHSKLEDQPPVYKSKNAKKYKCDLCGRGFSRSNTLITHRRIHTGEKPFECNICGRAFRQPGNLTRHKLTHTTIKPYSCNKCGKAFNRVSNLHAHIKIHSDGKPYVCIVCGVGFYQKVDLKVHALSHSNDKIHECSFCKRTFKQAAHLKYHLHSHLKQFDKYESELLLENKRNTNNQNHSERQYDQKVEFDTKKLINEQLEIINTEDERKEDENATDENDINVDDDDDYEDDLDEEEEEEEMDETEEIEEKDEDEEDTEEEEIELEKDTSVDGGQQTEDS